MTNTISIVRHRVADFGRLEEGVRRLRADPSRARRARAPGAALSRESNDVIVTHTFDSREAASAFFAMPELRRQ